MGGWGVEVLELEAVFPNAQKPLQRKRLRELVQPFLEEALKQVNCIFSDNHEVLTRDVRPATPLIVPEFAWVAEIGSEPVGFILSLPDINAVLRDLNGRLTCFGLPTGLIKLLRYKHRAQKGRLIALGVVEKYRRAGIAEMLVLRVIEETMIKRGITGELSMTLEDNYMINRFLQAIGAERYKTYRIYSKSIA